MEFILNCVLIYVSLYNYVTNYITNYTSDACRGYIAKLYDILM